MRRMAAGVVMLLAAAACGDAGTPTQTIGSVTTDEPVAPLDAVLESWDATIEELPLEWERHAEWVVEGAETSWATGCPAFDRLAELFRRDTPQVVVWRAEGVEATQRVASLDWDTPGYVANVRSLPDTCPVLEVGGVAVELAQLSDGVLAIEPNSDAAAVELSAYPIPDPDNPGASPAFDPDRRGYLIVLARHNVVSQLVVGVSGDEGLELVDGLVAAADAALQSAPVEATGPFPAPTTPSTLPAQRIDAVELRLDREGCRNGGGVDVDGFEFALIGAVPIEWGVIDPIIGSLVIDGKSARFTGPDGEVVALTTAAVPAECVPWEIEPPPAPVEIIDRLDCTGRGIAEQRVADEGQTPEALASAARAEVVEVEPGQPLQWWGIDAEGVVVVGVFLGDAPGADYQVFTCADG